MVLILFQKENELTSSLPSPSTHTNSESDLCPSHDVIIFSRAQLQHLYIHWLLQYTLYCFFVSISKLKGIRVKKMELFSTFAKKHWRLDNDRTKMELFLTSHWRVDNDRTRWVKKEGARVPADRDYTWDIIDHDQERI